MLGLTSPSLFSAATAVVLSELQDIPDGPSDELVAYVAEPAPEVALVLMHGGGQKGKKVLDSLRAAAAVNEVKIEAPKYERDFVGWVRGMPCGRRRTPRPTSPSPTRYSRWRVRWTFESAI